MGGETYFKQGESLPSPCLIVMNFSYLVFSSKSCKI